MKLTGALLWAFAAIAVAGEQQLPLNHQDTRPNIVVILTDDQDVHLDSLSYMPLLKKYLTDQGTLYKSHYCTTAICCPARVTLFTGRNAHNTNVTDVFPPYGGYPKFIREGWNSNWLPLWLQAAGYSTYYTGKLFNAHSVDNYNKPFPRGWTSSDFLLDPYTYQYLNATFQRNRDPPVNHFGEYSTDVLAEKAYWLLDEGINSKRPFFLMAAPVACHSNVNASNFHYDSGSGIPPSGIIFSAPIPADRHKDLFPDAKVPRTANFNPEKPSGASWVKHLTKLTDEVIAYNDNFYRRRLQALQAVDEMVEGIVKKLEDNGILDNTYIIYSSDNGYHISQHRLNPGKECSFEEDINIPLIIKGPNVPVGETSVVTAHADLAPTILKLVGAKTGWSGLDGSPIPLSQQELEESKITRQEHVNVEFWGRGLPEGEYGFSLDDGKVVGFAPNNTYKALRIIGDPYDLLYTVWCSNEHELYDMKSDPGQLHNLYPKSEVGPEQTLLGNPLSKLLSRLDALLMVTKSCKAGTCIEPWSVIHPAGNVKTLSDAMRPRFDSFYSSIANSVSYDRCELGYILESEGQQEPAVFRENIVDELKM